MSKRLLDSPIVQFLIGRSIGLYMKLVGGTTRWRVVNRGVAEEVWDQRQAVLLCVWHGRFMLAHKLWKFARGVRRPKMLVSQSREGRLIGHAAHTVGAPVISGSAAKGTQQKGGFEASREMKRWIDGGGVVCLTPDGPRGPRMHAKIGVAQVARLSNAAMMPVAWSTRWRIVIKSWDRMIVPLPFGPGVLVWGDIIPAPSRGDENGLETARAALELEMNRVSAEADRLAGVEVIEPAAALHTADDARAAAPAPVSAPVTAP